MTFARIMVVGLFGLVLVILPPMANASVPYVSVVAGMPPGPSGEDEGLFMAEASGTSSFAWLTGSEAYGHGTIATNESGTSKAWCQITGHDPYMGWDVSGSTSVESLKPFVIESATLPIGTPVTVALDLSTVGSLEAREGFAGLFARAFAEFSLNVTEAGSSDPLAERAGDAEVKGYSDHDGLDTFGDWSNGLTPLGDGVYAINYSDTLTFTGIIGHEYSVYFELITTVGTSGGATPDTYNDTFAKADFSNTATYTLGSSQDVTFHMVPEPAALALLGLAGLLVRGRR